MNELADHTVNQFEREIDCPMCEREGTKLRAWASLDGLDRFEVESIEQLSNTDVRLLVHYGESGIDGTCKLYASGQPARERLAALG